MNTSNSSQSSENNEKFDFLEVIDAEEILEETKKTTLEKFWEGIKQARFSELTREEAVRLVNELYFSSKPLTHLTNEEEVGIRRNLETIIMKNFNRMRLKELTEEKVIYVRRKLAGKEIYSLVQFGKKPSFEEQSRFYVYLKALNEKSKKWNEENIAPLLESGRKFLTPQEKLELFSNPEVWVNACYVSHIVEYNLVKDWFMRPLIAYRLNSRYGIFSREDWFENSHCTTENFKAFVKARKKEKIRMLDVGGGMGQACYDAEQICNEVKATNLTIEEYPAMFSVETVFSPAERMPLEFKEQFDIIFSNSAFRYFSYPNIALENCLQALSVGGEAKLIVEARLIQPKIVKDPLRDLKYTSDSIRRLVIKYQRLRELAEKGYIELRTSIAKPVNEKGGFDKDGKYILVMPRKRVFDFPIPREPTHFPTVFLEIKKLKSLGEV